jgi:5'-deoxynucleotidase YfbR-like HD superfamily hydrolase
MADYFLGFEKDLNREKVFEMLIYHDLVEIESGDINLIEEEKREGQEERERENMEKLAEKLPESLREKFISSFTEFLTLETRESRFCRAIDRLESAIHELDHKKDWKGWTEEFLRRKTQPHYEEFPSILDAFEEFIRCANEEGFFTQE